jgi:hypothetical protein
MPRKDESFVSASIQDRMLGSGIAQARPRLMREKSIVR